VSGALVAELDDPADMTNQTNLIFLKDVRRGNSYGRDSSLAEKVVARAIPLGFCLMLLTVYFNAKGRFSTVKVKHVRADRNLPTKPKAGPLSP
jgi:hypothetical protein